MAKKTTARKRKATTADLQRKIERFDREIIKLISDRGKLSAKLCQARVDSGEPLFDPNGDQETINTYVSANKGPLSADCMRGVAREIISGSRALATPIRVSYLGPEFSYSHIAAIEKFGTGVQMRGEATISAVFEALNRHQADYGLAPIANSTDGRVVDTLSMFARLPVQICGEVQLRIHHYLLGKCAHDEVREVYSKPQALSQCRDWLAKHLPMAKMVEMTSTAAAARLAADRPGAAAVASRQAGVQYGLNEIAVNIEDNSNNITRFAVIGGDEPKRTGQDKTALMFEISHAPGSLADTMAIFKRANLNLTWIESFPVRETDSEFIFFIEIEGHRNEAAVKRALAALEKKATRLEVLGSYAKTEPLG